MIEYGLSTSATYYFKKHPKNLRRPASESPCSCRRAFSVPDRKKDLLRFSVILLSNWLRVLHCLPVHGGSIDPPLTLSSCTNPTPAATLQVAVLSSQTCLATTNSLLRFSRVRWYCDGRGHISLFQCYFYLFLGLQWQLTVSKVREWLE